MREANGVLKVDKSIAREIYIIIYLMIGFKPFLRSTRFKHFWLPFGASLPFVFAPVAANLYLKKEPCEEKIQNKYVFAGWCIDACIIAPILEELIFRKPLIVLANRGFMKSAIAANIMWSGIVFGAIHPHRCDKEQRDTLCDVSEFAYKMDAGIYGLTMGGLAIRYRCLKHCMFGHFINNSLATCLIGYDFYTKSEN